MQLEGKVAVVTGAASGIGRALAERFAREGMKVVLADIEEGPLAAARDALAQSGAQVLAVQTDVSRGEQVEALAQRTFEAFGTAHVVCNNAGVGVGGPAWQIKPDDWEWILGVNLWGVIHGIRAFVPRMVEQEEGHVVNTASIAGLVAAPGMAAYCGTKHAVVGVSECLLHDLTQATGGKVGVSVLCPAWVRTNIADSERNRPPAPEGTARRAPTARDRKIYEKTRATIAAGIPAEEVADKVLAAVVENRFWVLTHPKTKAGVEARMRGILDGTNPEFEGITDW
ncbi:MAG TPA: SDR family NAD(P)-dependent oxidoreductase [Polyangiaceae bacterium]|jgi:NAD(P)-dependent dehydrogenase (short-subunit alcohol dehydrogenase family)|nr:SDR family NAD(P)-dependent oxidoreductase [Polyangiaceae bacterium]